MGGKDYNLFKISIVFLIILSLFGCQANQYENTEKEIAVEVMAVKKKNISKNATLNAYLEPHQNAIIIPKTPGLNVTNIDVHIGHKVSKGDFLFELDKTMVRKQIEQSKQVYDLARRNYEEQKRQLEASTEYNSLEDLTAMYQNKLIGDFNIPDLSKQDKNSVLAASINQVEQARIAYSNALNQLEQMEYYAPISGYVSQLNISENQPILSTQPALIITNMDKLKASINVSKSIYEHLKEEQSVKVNVDGKQFEGKIKALSPIPDLINNLYSLEIEVENIENESLVGAFSNILIELDKKDSAVVIPKSSILEDDAGTYVFVESDQRVYRRSIDVGIDDGREVEIISGVNEGERIVTKGQQFVKDKGFVIIVRGEDNENL